MNTEEVVRQANEAKRMPSREASYRNLILNQRVEARNPFVSHQVWLDNGRTQIGHLEGAQVYGGLDLSATNDLTALVLAAKTGDEFDIHSTFWLPENNLHEKAKSDRVPYDVWARDGFLETTPGSAIEYEWVAQYLRDLFDSCDVQGIAFDRYNMRFLKPWLEKVGFSEAELEKFEGFGQGFVSMSPALRELEAQLLNKKLRHGNHPVLTMCAANAVVQTDPAGNRKFTKSKSTGRIDGMVALAMALDRAMVGEEMGDINDFINDPIML
ncbi:MAG: terminase, partial [Aestuariibacter sp.]|nr:terminase [Aestuariibacter sp.]